MIETLEIPTGKRCEFIDITHKINTVLKKSGVRNGLCHLFVPHTSAAVTINENADSSVPTDIVAELNKIIPFNDNYRHSEGNSAAHIKSSLIGQSELFIIADGVLSLGTWQGIFFCEFDGPRRRKLIIRITDEK